MHRKNKSGGISVPVSTLLAAMLLPSTGQLAMAKTETQLPAIQILGSDAEYKNIPGSLSVVTEKELDRSQPISAQDALKKVPGVNVVETDGYGFYPRIGIRGIGSTMSKKILLMEDGAPIALGPYTDPSSYYSPPIERMEKIEVLKGSGSLAYGPSTIGGVVNYITRDPSKLDGPRVKLSAGTASSKNILAEYATRWDDHHASISMLKKDGDGWRHTPFNLTDVVMKAGTRIGSDHYVGVKYTNYDQSSKHSYLGLTEYEYQTNYKQNKAVNDQMFIKRESVDLTSISDFGNNTTWKNLLYWNSATRDWWRQSHTQGGDPVVTTMGSTMDGRLRRFDVLGLDSRLTKKYQLGGHDQEIHLGVRAHEEKMMNRRARAIGLSEYAVDTSYTTGNYVGGYRERDLRQAKALAFYLENRTRLTDQLTVTPGVRIERYKQDRTNQMTQQSGVSSNTEVVPGIGVTYDMTKDSVLFAGVHKGFAPPTVADAISSTGVPEDLHAERSTNYELGLRGQWAHGDYEFTAFRLDFDNQIVSKSASGGSGTQLTNAGKTLNQGLELAGSWKPHQHWKLSGSYTWLPIAKLEGTRIIAGQNRDGNRLTYAPKHTINAGLDYETHRWSSGLGVTYLSQQFSNLENTVAPSDNGRSGVLPGYAVYQLNGAIKVDKKTKLFASVKNLFDKKYISSRAPEGIFPGVGRSVMVGIDAKF
jgi:Fe(3+) dicitrate transport protein